MHRTAPPLADRGPAAPGLLVPLLTVLCLAAGFAPAAPAQGPVDLSGVSRISPCVAAVRRAAPSVLNLHSVKTTYEDDSVFNSRRPKKVNGMGTAIVVDPRGYLLTNHHVVDGVESLRATDQHGTNYVAVTLSTDPEHDLALVKIEARDLPVMPLGTSCDLMLGETVFAIGNAFGYEHTVSKGIVSQLFRDVEVTETQSYRNLIQTDASINPGNSGGPLVNVRGEVIGINVAIRAGAQRIGFAIPIDDAREVLADLMSVERLENRSHGVRLSDRKTAGVKQAIVARVDAAGGAGGLIRGDVVEKVGRTAVADAADFERALLGVRPGVPVTLTVLRDGRRVPVQFRAPGVGRVAAAPRGARQIAARATTVRRVKPSAPVTGEDALQALWNRAGVAVERVGEQRFREETYPGGFRITRVRPGGPVAAERFAVGDIVVGWEGFAMAIPDDLAYVLNAAAESGKVQRLDVLRNDRDKGGPELLYGFVKLDAK